MTIGELVTATGAGKIEWRVHDNNNGYWAHVDNGAFRLDLVDGVYTLYRGPVLVETLNDTEDALDDAIAAYVEGTKTALLSAFAEKIA